MVLSQSNTGAYVSVADAAQMIDRSERTIWRMVRDGRLPSFLKNGQRCVIKAEIERLLKEMPDLARPLPERVEVLEECQDDHAERIASLEEYRRNQDATIERLQRQIQQLLDGDLGLPDRPHRRSHSGQGRHYDPGLRGFPSDTVSLKDFALKHQIAPYDLMKLHKNGEICLELHRTNGASGRHEWWVTPEQHQQVSVYCQQQGIPYTPCRQCEPQEVESTQAG